MFAKVNIFWHWLYRLQVPSFSEGVRSPSERPGTYPRSFNRNMNFSPDQTSSTAQTFTSTSPLFSPKSRMLFSSRSVGTLADFLGQETQSIPSLLRNFLYFRNS